MKKILLVTIAFLCCFSGGGKAENERRVPVIMYHSVCKTNVGEYVISPERLEADMKYLADRGYTAVFVSDIVKFCDGKCDLPPKPVVLTFDDGFYNNLYYALPIAQKYGFKISVGVVGSFSDKERGEIKRSPVYSYLNSAEIAKLHKSGAVEITNHTYAMHNTYPRKGVRRLKGESEESYRAALVADSEKCRKLIEKACGVKSEIFVYPFGCYSALSTEILAECGYRAFLTCKGGVNVFKKGSCEGLEGIMRYNRPGRTDSQTFFGKIGVK